MTDLQIAKEGLAGHTICLCKDGECLTSDKRGIAPMMGFLESGVDLAGYSVADLIVGKATALLFVKSGIKRVFAKTLSERGRQILERYGVDYEYETLTEVIQNRAGTDICPMERAVEATCDPEEAYTMLKERLRSMKQA